MSRSWTWRGGSGCRGRRCTGGGPATWLAGWRRWRTGRSGRSPRRGRCRRRLRRWSARCAGRILGGVPRRIRAELAKRPEFAAGTQRLPHRSSIYRILVRFDLLTVKSRKRKRGEYKRWQRDAPMELWQLDIVGSCFLADGRELKVVTGVDDYSRFCVIAAVVPRATARAVCTAFVHALLEFGCPQQVLTDNGKQFTGRFGKPRPAEVLFERICRRNGIETILTKPR